MSEDYTARFKVDISDLKKNITEARKEIKLADAAFKAGTAGMDDWKNDAEGLSKKLEQLKTVLNSQKTILSSYQQQLERQEAAYRENGSRADQLRKKLQELADSGVSKTSDEYKKYQTQLKSVLKEQESNGKAADDLRIKVLNQEAAVGKTEKELRNYSKQLDSAGDEAKEFAKAEDTANISTEKLSEGFTVMKGALANLITDGLRKAGEELKSLITDGAAYADEILTLSKTTSVSTDELQKFAYMSDLVDVDLDTVAKSLQRLTKNMDSARGGTGSAYEAFNDLGVSVTDVNGNLRDNEEVFADVIGALGKMENETERDAKAMAIFGKSATDLNPLIEAGSDAIKDWSKEAEDMGYVMDEDMLGSLGELQDSFDRLDRQVTAAKNQIGAALAPTVERAVSRIQSAIKNVDWDKVGEQIGNLFDAAIDGAEWIIKNAGAVKAGLAGILAAFAASKIMAAVEGVKKMTTALKTMASAANANPYVLLVSAIAVAGAALIKWQKRLADAEKAADAGWQKTEKLKKAMDDAAESAMDAVESYKSMNETLEDGVAAGIAQGDHLRDLKTELESLADANGVVAESDRARAQMILSELNSALGTEYTMTGNVIDQYSELEGSIDSLIQKKQAMLILEAEEDAYKTAIIEKANAEDKLRALEEQRIPIQNQIAENEARVAELLSATGPQLAANAKEVGDLNFQNVELNKSLKETQDEYEQTAKAIDGYTWDITQYTNNATAAINEDYDSISHKSYETAVASGQASKEASEAVINNARTSAFEWLGTLNQMVSDTTGKQVEFRDAGYGMVQAYVDGQKMGEALPAGQVESMAKQMGWYIQRLEQQMQASGQNMPAGVASGIYENGESAFSAIGWLANNILARFNSQMQIKSPSRKFKWSALQMIAGIVGGVDEGEPEAVGAMEDLAGRMTNAFRGSLKIGKLNAEEIAGSSMQMAQAPALGGVYGSGTGGQIINQNYTQNIYSPKPVRRIDIYRGTANILAYAGGK